MYSNYGVDYGMYSGTMNYLKSLKKIQESVGLISIENGIIKAHLPTTFYLRGMRQKTFFAYFEGEIKNRDTIVNWRMVEPYPKAPRKFNDDFKELIEPKLMYFIESKELLALDSLYQSRIKEEFMLKK